MLLAVDIGNSNVTLALARDGVLGTIRRVVTNPRATPDELEVMLDGLLRLDGARLGEGDPDRSAAPAGGHGRAEDGSVRTIAACTTVPALGAALEVVADRRRIPCLVASGVTVPIAIHTERPGEVGPDRLVNAYAAAHLYGIPAIVVDCGTATTIDAIDEAGAFIGGAIAPGLEIGLESLAARTARLPRVELRLPDTAIGKDTAAAIRSGTVLGHRAMIEGLLVRIRRELAASAAVAPEEVRTILTGGLSMLAWARTVEGVDAVDPALTLRGLVAFHRAVGGSDEDGA